MTRLASRAALPTFRTGGPLGHVAAVALAVLCWGASVLLLAAGFVPELDGDESELGVRITMLVLGIVVAALPVVLLWLPHRRRVTRLVAAVLALDAPHPELPPVSQWSSPARMFQRLRWTAYTSVLIPLITLLASSASYWLWLDEDAAGIVSLVFCAVPLAFLAVTVTLPDRVADGVRAGLEAGQVLAVRVTQRLDRPHPLTAAYASWFETVLPDGQRVLLRTPVHFAWSAESRGVVESPDLALVIGRGGHQGALVVPGRPQDAVWLLGPVPQVRVPRDVLRAFG